MRLLVAAAVGAVGAKLAVRAVRSSRYAPALDRTNFRGRTVSLAGGPALALASTVSAAAAADSPRMAAAALTAGLGAGAVGLYDDVAREHSAKGFRGHLAALRQGRITSGTVKVAGIGAAGLVASALLPGRARGRLSRAVEVLLGAGVVAGTANLVNLLDLRPGRAGKAGLLLGVPLALGSPPVAGPVAAAVALLPDDLGEEIMLGDCGANALGAHLGLGLAARTGPAGRAGVLLVLGALTAASEKVSFTQVIERTPGLRELDALGRRS